MSPHNNELQHYTIIFGVHDDGTVDGYRTTDGQKDATTQMIHTKLDKLKTQNFDRKIQWIAVVTHDEQSAYVLSVTFTPHTRMMNAVVNNGEPIFWIRKGNKTQKMSFEEIQIGFRHQVSGVQD